MLSLRRSGAKIAASLGALALMSAGVTHAQVTGSLWEGDLSGNASVIPSGSANVTFTTPGINFHSGGAYTIGEFLASSGSTVLTGSGELGNGLDNVHIELNGSLFLSAGANPFDIAHDDGLVLSISGLGTVLNAPGPTSPTTTPFTVTAPSSGVYSYTLEYNECCGAPAVLSWTYPTGGPVGSLPDTGSTLILLSLVSVGLFAGRKRLALQAV